jgi:hypothetical protein
MVIKLHSTSSNVGEQIEEELSLPMDSTRMPQTQDQCWNVGNITLYFSKMIFAFPNPCTYRLVKCFESS